MTDQRDALGLPAAPQHNAPAVENPAPSLTFDQALGSLDGFDEIAIAKNFHGVTPYDMERRLGEVMRATAWILAKRRDPSAQPRDYMKLTILQLQDHFAAPDVDPEGEQEKGPGETETSPDGAHTPGSGRMSTGD